MKMKYEKPMVAVDRYELTQAIAGCDLRINLANRQCFLDDEDVTDQIKSYAYSLGWFVDTTGVNGCSIEIPAGQTYDDGFCYHTNVNGALNS